MASSEKESSVAWILSSMNKDVFRGDSLPTFIFPLHHSVLIDILLLGIPRSPGIGVGVWRKGNQQNCPAPLYKWKCYSIEETAVTQMEWRHRIQAHRSKMYTFFCSGPGSEKVGHDGVSQLCRIKQLSFIVLVSGDFECSPHSNISWMKYRHTSNIPIVKTKKNPSFTRDLIPQHYAILIYSSVTYSSLL